MFSYQRLVRGMPRGFIHKITAGLLLATVGLCRVSMAEDAFRPPAAPLVTSDPYLSVWSEADRLTDDVTRHWTHHPHSLVSMIRVDGVTYRLMGQEPVGVPPLPQTSVTVTPTRSIYTFANDKVHVTLTFMTAALPDDLDVLTRPLSYITWTVVSADGRPHAVRIFESTSTQICVNSEDQKVTWDYEKVGDLTLMKAGTVDQPILQNAGDDTRIDWGYVYAAANAKGESGEGADFEESGFKHFGELPGMMRGLLQDPESRRPRPVNDHQPVLAFDFDLGNVGSSPASCHEIVAYDEIWSIDYFGKRLRPYWRRNGATPETMLAQAEQDYPSLVQRCTSFDNELMADMTKVGGAHYAQMAALAYRQCLAATGIAADPNGKPLLFTKENTSNGDIATVDVIFPMDPIFVFLSPTLAKASLAADLAYSASPHWKFPNAPHDLGTYPLAYGTDDGGEGMPVEESGNILILCDAIAKDDGDADFVSPWWPQLTEWAHYLEQYGLDPEDQLCTDDFMGHLAHNANLSVKAILGLAAYGDLCRLRGDSSEAARYHDLAAADAKHWVTTADAGDHSLLAFDKPGTWSQKYNLVWDKILGLNIFPAEVSDKEIAFYKSVLKPYGLPLDSRTLLTKSDWTVWSATLASNRSDFETLVDPLYNYLDHTSTHDPLSDSYWTDDMHSGGMHARPVVGGVFIKMLTDPAIWHKWSGRDSMKVAGWAPIPAPPKVTEVVPTSRSAQITWAYTVNQPPDGWTAPTFDASTWSSGIGPFGTDGTPGISIKTVWNTDDIWLRRTFTVPAGLNMDNLRIICYHDEDIDVYFNGVPAGHQAGYRASYVVLDISDAAKAQLVPGSTVTMAVHCHQTTGGQGIDVGLAEVS